MTPENHYIETYINHLLAENPHLKRLEDSRFLYDKEHNDQLVPILAGGGSGHEPAHLGYVGQGMLTGALVGDIFVPPTADDILKALRFLDKGKGILVIIKNFEADRHAFNQAIKKAQQEGIKVEAVISFDDISVDTTVFERRHRGVAGTIFLHKILGQAAATGASLEELKQLGLALTSSIATLGFATQAPHSLTTGQPLFELAEGFISYGVGIHGEPGYKTVPFISSEKLAIELINKLKMFFRWQTGEHYALIINNLGITDTEEQSRFQKYVLELLEIEEIVIDFVTCGRFMTNLDMAGLSLSMCRLKPEWLQLLKAPCRVPTWMNALK